MRDLFIGFVVGCAVGYVARVMLSRYRRERVRRERVEGRYGL
jgi:NhaP-type Na+/H+ or K+/H+ antiporter